jgi:hypothetical protein
VKPVNVITIDSYRSDPEHQRFADALMAANDLDANEVTEMVRCGSKWLVRMFRWVDFSWPPPNPADRREVAS